MGPTEPITRRKFLVLASTLVSAVAGVGLATGCQPAAAPAPAATPAPAAATAAPAAKPKVSELSMLLFDNYWNDSLNAMLKKYQQEQGVQVKWEMPPLSGFYQRQMSLSLAKEKTPDILACNDTILSQYASQGLLEPLDDYLKDSSLTGADYNWTEYTEQTRNAASWSKGSDPKKVYAIPIELATWCYFYRSDLIDKPPETWAQYIEISKQFTQSINPKSPTQYGAAVHGKTLPMTYKEWYAWLWSYGGDIFDANLNPVLNSAQAVKSLDDDYGLQVNFKAMPPDTNTYDDAAKTAAFQNSLFPHCLNWTHQFPVYLDAAKSPKIAGKVKYAMVPGMPGPDGKVRRFPYAQQWHLAVNPNGQNKQDAFKFIAWLTSPKGVLAWAQAGYVGVIRPSVLKDPELQKKMPDFVVRLEAVAIGRYAPTYIPQYAQIADSELNPQLSQVLAGSKSAKAALDTVNEKATAIMKEAGYIK